MLAVKVGQLSHVIKLKVTSLSNGNQTIIFDEPISLTCEINTPSKITVQSTLHTVDCTVAPCLFLCHNDSNCLIIDELVSYPGECENDTSYGYYPDVLSTISCTDNITEPHVFESTDSICKRNKCKCKDGFRNGIGWNCSADLMTKGITFVLATPLMMKVSSISLTAEAIQQIVDTLESTMKTFLKGNIIDGPMFKNQYVQMLFTDFKIITYSVTKIGFTRKRRRSTEDALIRNIEIYSELAFKYNCNIEQCDEAARVIGKIGDTFEEAIKNNLKHSFNMSSIKVAAEHDIDVEVDVPNVNVLAEPNRIDFLAELYQNEANEMYFKEQDELVEEKLFNAVAAKIAFAAMSTIPTSVLNGNPTMENTAELTEEELEEELDKTIKHANTLSTSLGFTGSFGSSNTETSLAQVPNKDETDIIQSFASLTPAELAAIFGEYKPINALNPYMAKVDPCQAVSITSNVTLGSDTRSITTTLIKHNRLFLLRDFYPNDDCVGALEVACLEMAVIMPPSMTRELQIQLSRDGAYVNLIVNRKRWDDYLAGNIYTNETLYPSFQKWAKKPLSQVVLHVTLRRYINDLIETRQAYISVIIPRSNECNYIRETSGITTSTIVNKNRQVVIQPPTNWWGTDVLGSGDFKNCTLCEDLDNAGITRSTPVFECDFRAVFRDAIFRTVDSIFDVREIEVNRIRHVECNVENSTSSTCYIVEFSIQVDSGRKLVNGDSLEKSLDEALDLTLNELQFILKELPKGLTRPVGTDHTSWGTSKHAQSRIPGFTNSLNVT